MNRPLLRTQPVQNVQKHLVPHLPPHDDQLETVALGAMLIDPGAIRTALGILKSNANVFYNPRYRAIFLAIIELHLVGRSIDVVTLLDQLRRSNTLDVVGGPTTLIAITNRVDSSANIATHCALLLELHTKRQVGEAGRLLVTRAFDPSEDCFELLGDAQRLLSEQYTALELREPEAIGGLVDGVIDQIAIATQADGHVTGVPCGVPSVDRWTGGYQRKNLIIVAARPAMGKTTWALFGARHAAQQGMPVAFFSLEMGKEELVRKLVGMESKYSTSKLSRGDLEHGVEEAEHIRELSKGLRTLPLYIDDSAGLTVSQLRAKCARLKAERGIRIVIVDYLQLMHGETGRGASREQEVSSISRGLKLLAKELDVPVIALSQLSREVEKRPDKRPLLSDLRESGSLEQDADVVAFLYRAEYYKQEFFEDGTSTQDVTEFIISKHRNGPLQDIPVRSVLRYGHYEDLLAVPPPPRRGTTPAPATGPALSASPKPDAFPTSDFANGDDDYPF